jgi:hypothetical protein
MKLKKSATLIHTLSVRIDQPTLDRLVAGSVGQRRRLSDFVRLVLERNLTTPTPGATQ